MKCKNCGCGIINEKDTDGWKHYPVKGDLDFCKYYATESDCGCSNPEPIDAVFLGLDAKGEKDVQ